MRASHKVAGLLLFTVLSFHCTPGIADQDEHALCSASRVGALVKMLASKNSAPDENATLENNYDKDAQAVVFLAIQQLLSEGPGAFDELVKHLDDARYSYSCDTPAGLVNVTVGIVCYEIMCRNICCYEDFGRLNYISRSQHRRLPEHQRNNIKMWWAEKRGRPFWQIQADQIEKEIALMQGLDYQTALSSHPNADKLPIEQFQVMRLENIQTLHNLKAAITSMKEPYRPKSLAFQYSEITGLPWVTRALGR